MPPLSSNPSRSSSRSTSGPQRCYRFTPWRWLLQRRLSRWWRSATGFRRYMVWRPSILRCMRFQA